jgi:5'-nucleotidase / UDP-sugar diphosphatase
MKYTLRGTLIIVMTLILSVIVAYSQPDTLTIIHVNDTHGNLTPYANGRYGGIARVASVVGNWKMTEPNPLFLHSGDLMVGTLMFNTYFGVPELQILDMLGLDVMTAGNHEFDFGPDMLTYFLSLANPSFDIISTNALNVSMVSGLDAYLKPYAVREYGDLKVGIIGLTTPAANIESNPAPVEFSEDLATIIGTSVTELKMAGCDIVVLLSHMGLPYDLQIGGMLSAFNVPVDVIVGGHTHTVLNEVMYGGSIPIVHAGAFYRHVGKLQLLFDGSQTSVLDYTLMEITDAVPSIPGIEDILNTLQAGVYAQYYPILGDPFAPITYAPVYMNAYPLSFDYLDSPMGNLITAAMLNYVGDADFALEANGHIVEPLFKGNVSASDLFRSYPYGYETTDALGFRLAAFDLYGAEINGILAALLDFIHPEIGNYEYLIQSAGLDYIVDNTESGLQLGDVYINGFPVVPYQQYKIVSSDMIVNYLINLFGITPANIHFFPISVFQVAKEYIEDIDVLHFPSTGHNRAVPFVTASDIVRYAIIKIHLFSEYGHIEPGVANALIAKLNAAVKQIERGRYIPAVNALNAEKSHLAALVTAGKLPAWTAEEIAALIDQVAAGLTENQLAGQQLLNYGAVVADFSLHQNFPNPFNPVTVISYQLPVDTKVVLEVYNIIGQRVAVLVDGFVEAGNHQVMFDASSLPSGMFIYRLTTDTFTASKTLHVLK